MERKEEESKIIKIYGGITMKIMNESGFVRFGKKFIITHLINDIVNSKTDNTTDFMIYHVRNYFK